MATAADLLLYDFGRPYPHEVEWNRGCPAGYFPQFVAPGAEAAQEYRPGMAVRCRRLDTLTPTTIAEESGLSWEEYAGVVIDAAGDTAGDLYHAAQAGARLASWLLPAIIVGAALLLWRR
jgi:hypothetical protein